MGGNFYEAGRSALRLAGVLRPPRLSAADGRCGAEAGFGACVAGAIGRTGRPGR